METNSGGDTESLGPVSEVELTLQDRMSPDGSWDYDADGGEIPVVAVAAATIDFSPNRMPVVADSESASLWPVPIIVACIRKIRRDFDFPPHQRHRYYCYFDNHYSSESVATVIGTVAAVADMVDPSVVQWHLSS